MSEIKTQISGRHHGPCLLYVRPEHFTQGGMHQVSGRVIAACGIALLNINFRNNGIADFQGPFLDFDFVNDQPLRRRVGINN